MKTKQKTAIVTGAGGFIGSHLVRFLRDKGYYIIGVDIKEPDFSKSSANEFFIQDLRDWQGVKKVFSSLPKIDELYMLAADMGGVGYINTVNADIVHNSTLINLNSLQAAADYGIPKVFFASSACVYPEFLQDKLGIDGLKESDALPAQPDTPYGWEKLFTEVACSSYSKDYGIETRIARFHNIFGPEGTFTGGREKSPAAICRKIAEVKNKGEIEVWGDGKQERSYCYIDDCILGIWKLMKSEVRQPINIGSDEMISINQMVKLVTEIAGKEIVVKKNLSKPQGVRSRNANISMAREKISWQPEVTIKEGFSKTYFWIKSQLDKK